MEKREKIVPFEGRESITPPVAKEMNFYDLCVACGRAIGRACMAFLRLLAHMLRLTVRFWWIVLPILGLSIGLGLYCTRYAKTIYKVNSVVYLNGPSIQQFEQAYAPLRTTLMLPEGSMAAYYVQKNIVSHFDSYRVVDAKNDGVADYIDFDRKSSSTDTVRVQMADRLCLQFRVKSINISAVPEIEKAILELLNRNEAMQASYEAYKANLEQQVEFNHRQTVKLDSLTSVFYFNTIAQKNSFKTEKREWMPATESKINLFLDDIYEQQKKMQIDDYRLKLATAPVTLENHFAVDPKPLNSRRAMMPKYILLGWILGCVIAEFIYKRKTICAWIKL